MMPFSRLKQVNVMFGEKQRNEVTRQCQGGIAQKREPVWFPGSETGHQFGAGALPPLGEATPALPTVGAWLMCKPLFAPSLETRQDTEWLFLSPRQPKGSKLKTLKKLGKTK